MSLYQWDPLTVIGFGMKIPSPDSKIPDNHLRLGGVKVECLTLGAGTMNVVARNFHCALLWRQCTLVGKMVGMQHESEGGSLILLGLVVTSECKHQQKQKKCC
ncbi:hypothetical protein SDC9_115994 [bioreactor metagenome]|uniref:Uncharacterized protein n=1 Tax=bioreactor metagenome TaxID=1076179 RepID=A0A645BUC9_9ZZZZ